MIDPRLCFLARCSAALLLIECGEMQLEDCWSDLADAFLRIPTEFVLLEKYCDQSDVPF